MMFLSLLSAQPSRYSKASNVGCRRLQVASASDDEEARWLTTYPIQLPVQC